MLHILAPNTIERDYEKQLSWDLPKLGCVKPSWYSGKYDVALFMLCCYLHGQKSRH